MPRVGQFVEVHGMGAPVVAQVREVAGDVINVFLCNTRERVNGLRPVPGLRERRYWRDAEPAVEKIPEPPAPERSEPLGLFASTEDDIEST